MSGINGGYSLFSISIVCLPPAGLLLALDWGCKWSISHGKMHKINTCMQESHSNYFNFWNIIFHFMYKNNLSFNICNFIFKT